MKSANRSAVMVVLSVTAAVAHADLITTFTQAQYVRQYRELIDGAPRIDDNLTVNDSDVIAYGVHEYTFAREADPSLYPSVNSFGAAGYLRTEVSSTKFSLNWDFSSHADLTRSLGSGENMKANLHLTIHADVLVEAGTEYRITYTSDAGDLVGDDGQGLSNLGNFIVDGDALVPFTLGYGLTIPPTVEGDLSFTTVAPSDGTLELAIDILCLSQASASSPIAVWDQHAVGSFLIEVVTPCPADIDGNGTLNLDDVNTFATAFAGGDLLADLDGNGVLNLDDVNIFAASFVGGCP